MSKNSYIFSLLLQIHCNVPKIIFWPVFQDPKVLQNNKEVSRNLG